MRKIILTLLLLSTVSLYAAEMKMKISKISILNTISLPGAKATLLRDSQPLLMMTSIEICWR